MGRIRRPLAIVAMAIMAISANAYQWLSPYAYCMDNPVKFVDPDGRVVHPTDNNAFAILLNTLSPVDREYVVLNGYGNIDYGAMHSHNSESHNYAELKNLVSSDVTYNIYVQDEYTYIDNV